jgi:Protein of unknown function (DUF3705).
VAETADVEVFFTVEGDTFVPTAHARGPWAPDMLHGRLVGGLLARALEHEYGDPAFHFTRLTVDLFRSSPLRPVRIETRLAREGRRIRVADATLSTDQGVIGRAAAVLLRRGEQPADEPLSSPAWNAPEPAELGPPLPPRRAGWTPPFDLWQLDGRRVWLRELHSLIEGESPSPLVRAALAADFASPLANRGADGLRFINADYTLLLGRLPTSDAIGLESTGHLSDEGIAIGHCTMHDTSGPFAHCAVTAIANPQPIPGR